MTSSFIASTSSTTPLINPNNNIRFNQNPSRKTKPNTLTCFAAKQTGPPVKKQQQRRSNNNNKSKPPVKNNNNKNGFNKGFGVNDDFEDENDFEEEQVGGRKSSKGKVRYQPLPLPKPPAGFLVDDQGRVVAVSDRRIATIVDPANNFPLECVIRRVFRSSQGDECMLLCPIDTPVQILKSTNFEGWSAVSDDEVESILPTASYALAKIHMHLVYSGFCYTARGGFCYTEDDIFECRTDDGQDLDGLPTEGVEITCFQLDGSHYMIYTPSDPLLFVAVKDGNGQLRIADDEVLEDPLTVSAIDEETEFNALVEEEAALLESLLGKS